MTMSTKLPLALAFLLSAAILAAADHSSNSQDELRTQVPYYMIPRTFINGGVAPARVGNEKCPSIVKFTQEVDLGVPITFSTSAYDSGESVVIDDNTDVYISFNTHVCEERKTWGYRFASPLPSEVSVELATLARIYERPAFRIKKEGNSFKIYSPRVVDSDENVKHYYPVVSSDGRSRRLVLSSERSIRYNFEEAEKYDEGMIKSVV